jgi:uncharacterized glyoxalase superfamily protein PhnB
MPAYDRPIVINVPEQDRRRMQDSVGAVLQFNSNDIERVQAWLDKAAAAGIIAPTTARSYNSTYGGPVWYIP